MRRRDKERRMERGEGDGRRKEKTREGGKERGREGGDENVAFTILPIISPQKENREKR